jgi:hypothetical protein
MAVRTAAAKHPTPELTPRGKHRGKDADLMRSMSSQSFAFRGFSAGFALLLAACSSVNEAAPVDVATAEDALVTKPTTATTPTAPSYLQKKSVGAIGATPVKLANGALLRVDQLASTSLARHRQLESEVGKAGSALLGSATTVEEFMETSDTVMLVATTSMVVVDPTALKLASPIVAKLEWKGAAAMPLAKLPPDALEWFNGFKADMLKLSTTHPLGAAARRGSDALWTAALAGKGDFSMTSTVVIPKEQLEVDGKSVYTPVLDENGFDYAQTVAKPLVGVPEEGQPWEAEFNDMSSYEESGKVTTVSEFVNGYWQGDGFELEERWNFSIGSLKFKAGAYYEATLRAPIEVTTTMTPTQMVCASNDEDQESDYSTEVKVDLIDANAEFYSRAGVPENKLYEGQELAFEIGAYARVDLNLPGTWLDVHQTIPQNPGYNWGRNFRPPFGDCGTDCGFYAFIDDSITHTGFDLFGVIGGGAQIGFNVSGTGDLDFSYSSVLEDKLISSVRDNGDEKVTHRASFTKPSEMSFDTTLEPLTEKGSKEFGYELSDFSYVWRVVITPALKADAYIDCPLLHWDAGIAPIDFDFASIRLGSIALPPLTGTFETDRVTKGTKSWVTPGATIDEDNPFYADEPWETEHDDGSLGNHLPDGVSTPSTGPRDELRPLP